MPRRKEEKNVWVFLALKITFLKINKREQTAWFSHHLVEGTKIWLVLLILLPFLQPRHKSKKQNKLGPGAQVYCWWVQSRVIERRNEYITALTYSPWISISFLFRFQLAGSTSTWLVFLFLSLRKWFLNCWYWCSFALFPWTRRQLHILFMSLRLLKLRLIDFAFFSSDRKYAPNFCSQNHLQGRKAHGAVLRRPDREGTRESSYCRANLQGSRLVGQSHPIGITSQLARMFFPHS